MIKFRGTSTPGYAAAGARRYPPPCGPVELMTQMKVTT